VKPSIRACRIHDDLALEFRGIELSQAPSQRPIGPELSRAGSIITRREMVVEKLPRDATAKSVAEVFDPGALR
jgi:hypothetical protein